MSPSTLKPPIKELIQRASVAMSTAEPPADTSKKRKFVVTPQNASPRGRRILPVLIGLAMLALVVYTVQRTASQQDPHYVRATKMIADYEWGRLDSEKNYGHSVYPAALDELALVDAGSESAQDAQDLTQRLESLIAKWRAAQEEAVGARTRRDERVRERDLAFFGSQRTTRMLPAAEYPECEDVDSAKKPAVNK
jgi:hypothetical protein